MNDRSIAGVAAGLSDFLGVDIGLIRLVFILGTIFGGGAGFVIYVLLWGVVPPDNPTPIKRTRSWRGPSGIIVLIALIVTIGLFSNDHFRLGINVGLIPLIAAIIAFLILRTSRKQKSWKTGKEFEKARLAWQRRLEERADQFAPPTTPTDLGGNPFHIGSFYPEYPTDEDSGSPRI